MELGLQFEDIFCYEASPKVVSTHEESLETAIPEYCPDIARIVDTTGHLSIRERQLAEGRCTVSGSVKVTVLYTSEEAAGLRSLSVSVPFSYVLDERSLAGCGTICAQGCYIPKAVHQGHTGNHHYRLSGCQTPDRLRYTGGILPSQALPPDRGRYFGRNIRKGILLYG